MPSDATAPSTNTTAARHAPQRAPARRPAGPPATHGRDGIRIITIGEDGAVEHPDVAGLERIIHGGRCVAWIDLAGPTPDLVAEVGRVLSLHPLVAEDISELNERAKFEQVDGVFHIVLFALEYSGEVHETEVDFVLGNGFLLTAHADGWQPHEAPALRANAEQALKRGPDFLLYTIADWIIDGYFPVMDQLADEIDQLQDDVVAKATPWTLERLFTLKRELLAMRRAVSPAREIFNQLTNRDIQLIGPEHVVYFRDLYDHLIRVTDELDNYRELVSGTLDVYLSTVNNNLSLIMKRLTGVTVILAGIGAIAGIFGMSEAGAAFKGAEAAGFWAVAAATVALACAAAIFLRRIDWI